MLKAPLSSLNSFIISGTLTKILEPEKNVSNNTNSKWGQINDKTMIIL